MMAPVEALERAFDPIETLNASLERAWVAVCDAYDVSASMPDLRTLFAEADLSQPEQAAQAALVAMLMEVMESVSRFSPWYKQPARAFGLTCLRDVLTQRPLWRLAPEAIQRWQDILAQLSLLIARYSGLIRALVLVDDLMKEMDEDPCVIARCACQPPRSIQLRRSVLSKAEIICELCLQPFRS
jgi:hypothetical protein